MRIIAGTHKRRPLSAPSGLSTRPTTDRVREALFSILGDLSELEVLDCYAGSGALGFEALSRGAVHCTFIEASPVACRTIEKNATTLQLDDRMQLLCTAVEKAAPRLQNRHFDLVLADPPWPIHHAAAGAVVKLVAGRLNADARVVLGHPTRNPLELTDLRGLEFVESRSWGDSAMSFYRLAG
jgi:16S rRNA (guanine(966)-N(2))-methyltransferase RsmD